MARIKRGIVSKRKHNKLLRLNKGYRGTKRKLVKVAKEAALHAGAYAYQGRKNRKREMRALWITRIGEACVKQGLSYSQFLNKLQKANIKLDRKTLSEMVVNDLPTFEKIVSSVKD